MSYEELTGRYAKIADLRHANNLLSWDRQVYMPRGGAAARADAVATLDAMEHRLEAAEDIGDLIASARAGELDEWEAANVEEIHRRWIRARAVDADLVSAHSHAVSACQDAWPEARARNDWTAVESELQHVLDLTRLRASAIGTAFDCEPYDALLGEWEFGLTRAAIGPIFQEVKDAVLPMIGAAIDRQPAGVLPSGPFPIERQEALAREMMAVLGFDLERGRIDESKHPFTGGNPDDARITTRYDEQDFQECFFSTIHEVGHAVYEQQLPRDYRKQPVGKAAGLAVHESQSLLFEKILARSDPFLDYSAPILQRSLLGHETAAAEWQAENLGRLVRKVERSYIRTEADELTYPLHVILRYELETELLDGSLEAPDLPGAWEEKMSTYLGLSIDGNHSIGCLQDIHHYLGLIGYFPTYSIGAVMAAQLFKATRASIPDLDDAVRCGELDGLIGWLRKHVHSRGRSVSGADIIADATGSELCSAAYIEHLQSRYGYA